MDTRLLKSRELERGCTNLPLCEKLSLIDARFIEHVDRDIMSHEPGAGVLWNIDDYTRKYTERDPWYNSFPFGEETNEVFPRFLGICRGSMKLGKVMDAALEHCTDVIRAFGQAGNEERTVMILTDKWDEKTFKQYEEWCLKHAALDGIRFIFLLATDYGYTEIPFLDEGMYSFLGKSQGFLFGQG